MSNPIELSASQAFSKERFSRTIKESRDIEELRRVALILLDGWFTQKAATQWVISESLGKSARVTPEDLERTLRQ